MLFKDRLEIWNPGQLPYGLTPAKLSGKHSSEPTNPILAHPVYLAGYIERLGTGTNDMIAACAAKGLRNPEFVQDEDFRTIIWRKDSLADKVNDKVKTILVADNQRIVYSIINDADKANDKVKSRLTTSFISQETGLSYPTVQRIIAYLVKSGLVRREGADKNGYWIIRED